MDLSHAPIQCRTRPETGRLHFVAGVIVAALVLTGCGGGNSSSQPTTTPRIAKTAGPTASTLGATPDPNTWRDQFTADQLAAYDQALRRFDDYEQRSEPIWAAGKATPEAEALFKQYFPSPLWTTYYQQLQTFQASNVQVSGLPTVLSSKATAISPDSKTVTIEQCVDLTTSQVTQNGSPGTPVEALTKPVIRTLQLDKPDGYDWLIYRIKNPSAEKHVSCQGNSS